MLKNRENKRYLRLDNLSKGNCIYVECSDFKAKQKSILSDLSNIQIAIQPTDKLWSDIALKLFKKLNLKIIYITNN